MPTSSTRFAALLTCTLLGTIAGTLAAFARGGAGSVPPANPPAALPAPTITHLAAPNPTGPSIKALLITGGCCHDYATQKMLIAEGINKIANVEWTLIQAGGDRKDFINPMFDDPNWAQPYDVIIHDSCFADVKDPAYIRKILKPHFEGKAALVLHCAMHTFRDSPNADEYREFLGVTTHEHEPATLLDIKPLPAPPQQLKNPILTGFPENFRTPINDEMYIILKSWPNMTPLATGYGKVNNANFPCIWTNTYGKAKIFGTTLGHDTGMVKSEPYLNLLARGLLWTVDKLAPDGNARPEYQPKK